jgi:hypothetical protein
MASSTTYISESDSVPFPTTVEQAAGGYTEQDAADLRGLGFDLDVLGDVASNGMLEGDDEESEGIDQALQMIEAETPLLKKIKLVQLALVFIIYSPLLQVSP